MSCNTDRVLEQVDGGKEFYKPVNTLGFIWFKLIKNIKKLKYWMLAQYLSREHIPSQHAIKPSR